MNLFRQYKIFSILGAITIISLLIITSCSINEVNAPNPPVKGNTPSPKIVGEWKPEEKISGARVQTGTIGEIDDKNYLFLPVVNNYKQPPEQKLYVLDLQNPASPVEVGSLKTSEVKMFEGNVILDMALSGNALYLASFVSFGVIDVSNPSAPREIFNNYPFPASRITISGKYAYINSNRKLIVEDISDPVHPTVVGSLAINPWSMKAVGSLLFVTSWNGDGLHIIDISSPASLKEIGFLPNPAGLPPTNWNDLPAEQLDLFLDVAMAGKYAYIASGISGVRVIDISNPSSPKEVNNLKIEGMADRILISGNIAYLIESPKKPSFTNPTSLVIIDISDPAKPREISSIKFPKLFFAKLCQFGNYIYCYGGDPPVEIVDIYGTNK